MIRAAALLAACLAACITHGAMAQPSPCPPDTATVLGRWGALRGCHPVAFGPVGGGRGPPPGRGPPGVPLQPPGATGGPPPLVVPPAGAAAAPAVPPAARSPSAGPPAARRRLAQAPPPATSPYDAIAADPSLRLAKQLVDRAGGRGSSGAADLKSTSTGDLTVLAPTDAAVADLFKRAADAGRAPAAGTPADAIESAPPDALRRVVSYYTIPGVRVSRLPVGQHKLKTAAGGEVVIYVKSAQMAPSISDASGKETGEVVGTLPTRAGGEVAVVTSALAPAGLMMG